VVSSLEMELSKVKVQAHMLEQENRLLKEELEKAKQVWHPIQVPSGDGLEPPTCLSMGPALLTEMEIVNFSNQTSSCNIYYQ